MIDAHIHYAHTLGMERLNQVIQEFQFHGIALQCIMTGMGTQTEKDAFEFQAQCPIPVYIFGGLDRSIYYLEESKLQKALVLEAKKRLDMGCNGIKMLEGKPNTRKDWPIPDFDLPVWEEYWEFLEKNQIPVYMHVNDPEEFWDGEKVSEFAKKAGWFYDETYVNNEDQYRQMGEVLKKYPKLRILFPHFLFFSKQLDRLGRLLDRYPNVHIDVTPGIELYYNLSKQQDKARSFFEKYQDRICFGTDIGARSVISETEKPLSIEESRSRMNLITKFLETKGEYLLRPDGYYVVGDREIVMNGLGLSDEILEKIYESNFLNFIKKENKQWHQKNVQS